METSRQDSIVNPEILQQEHVLIIGIGAVGEVLAETLTRNGLSQITMFDFDIIEEHNCVTQGYFPDQVGQSKVECAAEKMLRINPEITINAVNDKWRPSGVESKIAEEHGEYTVIFSCVDSLTVRKKIYEYYSKKDRLSLLFDCRIRGQEIRVLGAFDDVSKKNYSESFTEYNGGSAVGCHIPMIKHSANIGSGLIIEQYFSALMGRDLFADRQFPLGFGTLIDLTKKAE